MTYRNVEVHGHGPDRRVVLASGLPDFLDDAQDGATSSASTAALLTLKDPSTGDPNQYLSVTHADASRPPSIQELNVFSPSTHKSNRYAAWFGPGDAVIKDGNLHIFTPININFLVLPALKKIQKENPSNFCGLDHVVASMECDPLAFGILLEALKHSTQMEHIKSICDVKENGGDVFVKLNDEKLLVWLKARVDRVCGAIKEEDAAFGMYPDEEMTRYGIGVVGEYISQEIEASLYAGYGLEKRVASSKPDARECGRSGLPDANAKGEDRAARRAELEERRKQQAKNKAKSQREEEKARKRAKEVEGIPKISSFFKKKK